MAVKGSGLGKSPDPQMEDRVTSTPNDPRSGAAKRTQKSFPDKWGMKDQTALSGVGPSDPGTGPDASSPNPLDPEPSDKLLRRQPGTLQPKWGMKDGMGNSLDTSIGGKVLGEAILSGSTKLPASTSEKTDSGAAPKPWPAEDSN